MATRLITLQGLEDVFDEFKLNQQECDQITSAACQAVTMEIHRQWFLAAGNELKSTRDRYQKGLIIADSGQFSKTITLVGILNNMVENGVGAFDMKEGFMKSAKVKFNKKGGWYLTIPYRIAAPDSLGENEVFSAIMPSDISDIMKGKAPYTSDGMKTGSGESLKGKEIPSYTAQTRASVTSEALGKTFDSYTHKSSIYEGMVRNQKQYENATQNTYGTFRRVGANSDLNAWIHSGIKQYNLAQKAIENTDVQMIVDNTVDKVLSDFGF